MDYISQFWINTYIDHDQASRLKDVATDRVKEDLSLKTYVNLHCWWKMLDVLNESFLFLNGIASLVLPL